MKKNTDTFCLGIMIGFFGTIAAVFVIIQIGKFVDYMDSLEKRMGMIELELATQVRHNLYNEQDISYMLGTIKTLERAKK